MPIGAARAGVRSLHATRPGLVVETLYADDIEARQATLWGELISLGRYDEADLFFEFAPATEDLGVDNRSGSLTRDEPGEYYMEVDGLEPDTAYHFRAVGIASEINLSVSTHPPEPLTDESVELRGELDELDHPSMTAVAQSLEFRTRPTLGVETRPAEILTDESAELRGDLVDFYPEPED
jgi:hypothetical protein